MRRDRTRFLATAMVAALVAAMTAAAQPDSQRSGVEGAALAPAEPRQASGDGGSTLRVGSTLDPAQLHPITRPGLYGMSQPPAGSRYGIVAGRLIRYDPDSAQVLSIIRQVDEILD